MKPDEPRGSRPAFLGELLETLTERGRRLLWRRDTQAGPPQPPELSELGEALLSRRGEASGVALAQVLLQAFDHADAPARLGFLKVLAQRFGPDPRRSRRRWTRWPATPKPSKTCTPRPSRAVRN